MTENIAAAKRTIVADQKKDGLSVRDLILVAVLIAAGAVLKLTVSSFLNFAGMKPNFMIAMYCSLSFSRGRRSTNRLSSACLSAW